MGSYQENQEVLVIDNPSSKAGVAGWGELIMYRDEDGKAKFVSSITGLPVSLITSAANPIPTKDAAYNIASGSNDVNVINQGLFLTNSTNLHNAAVADANGPAVPFSNISKGSFQIRSVGGTSKFTLKGSNNGGTNYTPINFDAYGTDISAGITLTTGEEQMVDLAGKWQNVICDLDWTSGTAYADFFGGN